MNKTVNLAFIVSLSGLLVACGGDDDVQSAGPGPALTPAQCPAAPSDLTLDEIAPVWGGLLVLNATVASGTADGFELEVFDPTLGGWNRSFGGVWQREDGRYAFPFTPSVGEHNRDAEFRVRLRSRLNGCAPSAWTEGPSYTLSDPLSDTTWVATWDASTVSGEINVTRFDVVNQASLEPAYPTFEGTLTHTVSFAADGVFDEVYEFTLAGREADEPFDGCSFVFHYVGTWEFMYERNGVNVLISDRAPAEDAADGSECTTPALSTLAINDEMRLADLGFSGTVISSGADYNGLLYSTPGPVRMDSYQLASALQNPSFLFALSYETAEETGNVSGYLGPSYYTYEKQ